MCDPNYITYFNDPIYNYGCEVDEFIDELVGEIYDPWEDARAYDTWDDANVEDPVEEYPEGYENELNYYEENYQDEVDNVEEYQNNYENELNYYNEIYHDENFLIKILSTACKANECA